MQIHEHNPDNKTTGLALLNLGFRVFFLGAGLFSILSILLWSAVYIFKISLPVHSITIFQWHAHEMIYGYSVAVIAGFLLTAVKNWTGVQTVTGKPLLLIFSLWAIARLLFSSGISSFAIAGIFDVLFLLSVILSISHPIIKVKQWKQLPIVFILVLLMTGNIFFYLGVLDVVNNGIIWGIYGGLYLVIGMVLTMGGRVIPFFIERGVGYPVKVIDSRWINITSHILFLVFFVSALFLNNPALSAYLALGLFLVNAIKLIGWHTHGIWKKSLLWSIYLAFWFICFGFLLFASHHFFGISKFLAIHAFAVGGIGLVTMGMMSRVALGHTGRNIETPHKSVAYALGILLLAAIVRVIVPLFDSTHYIFWIGLSQALWIVSFLMFTIIYLPILSKPRIDGQPG